MEQKIKTVVSIALADFFIFKMTYSIRHSDSKCVLIAEPALLEPFEGIAK